VAFPTLDAREEGRRRIERREAFEPSLEEFFRLSRDVQSH
jgi:hypothetical protein